MIGYQRSRKSWHGWKMSRRSKKTEKHRPVPEQGAANERTSLSNGGSYEKSLVQNYVFVVVT